KRWNFSQLGNDMRDSYNRYKSMEGEGSIMKYVIVGGDAAGMIAAMQIMKYDQSAHITILEKGNYYSYGQCGLPYLIGGVVKDEQQLVARDVDVYRDQFGMDAKVGHEVTNIN